MPGLRPQLASLAGGTSVDLPIYFSVPRSPSFASGLQLAPSHHHACSVALGSSLAQRRLDVQGIPASLLARCLCLANQIYITVSHPSPGTLNSIAKQKPFRFLVSPLKSARFLDNVICSAVAILLCVILLCWNPAGRWLRPSWLARRWVSSGYTPRTYGAAATSNERP